jgi:hypothetical protein
MSLTSGNFGFQPNVRFSLSEFATSTAGSPARRGPISCGTFSPVISSTARITYSTERPTPVPTLNTSDPPPASNFSIAATCASAKSVTWM